MLDLDKFGRSKIFLSPSFVEVLQLGFVAKKQGFPKLCPAMANSRYRARYRAWNENLLKCWRIYAPVAINLFKSPPQKNQKVVDTLMSNPTNMCSNQSTNSRSRTLFSRKISGQGIVVAQKSSKWLRTTFKNFPYPLVRYCHLPPPPPCPPSSNILSGAGSYINGNTVSSTIPSKLLALAPAYKTKWNAPWRSLLITNEQNKSWRFFGIAKTLSLKFKMLDL